MMCEAKLLFFKKCISQAYGLIIPKILQLKRTHKHNYSEFSAKVARAVLEIATEEGRWRGGGGEVVDHRNKHRTVGLSHKHSPVYALLNLVPRVVSEPLFQSSFQKTVDKQCWE